MSRKIVTDINEVPTEVIETDLLIIGGGNAGCFSAIEAKKLDPKSARRRYGKGSHKPQRRNRSRHGRDQHLYSGR